MDPSEKKTKTLPSWSSYFSEGDRKVTYIHTCVGMCVCVVTGAIKKLSMVQKQRRKRVEWAI